MHYDENVISVSLEDMSHVKMYCISLETQILEMKCKRSMFEKYVRNNSNSSLEIEWYSLSNNDRL